MVVFGLIGLLAMDNCGNNNRPETGFFFETGFDRFETGRRFDTDDTPDDTGDTPADTDYQGPAQLHVEPGVVTFEPTAVGSEATQTVELQNLGGENLIILDLRVDPPDADYSLGPLDNAQLGPGDSASFAVTFAPEQHGERSGVVIIESRDPENPVVELPLEGVGVGGALGLSPDAFDFGEVAIGTTSTQPLTFSNLGNGPLQVLEITANSGSTELVFDPLEGQNGPLPWVLEGGASVETTLTYTPTDSVADALNLSVLSDASSDPESTVEVLGVGAAQ